MRITAQICLILGLCLLGEVVAPLLPFPFPASVLAMIFLFLILFFKVIQPKDIKQKTDFMLSNMAFFFIPSAVGIMGSVDFIKSNLVQIIIISLVSTFLTFAATGYTVMLVSKCLKKKGVHHG